MCSGVDDGPSDSRQLHASSFLDGEKNHILQSDPETIFPHITHIESPRFIERDPSDVVSGTRDEL
jgi:hypothetical protein